ncbi:hypothetical protein SUVC_02G1960 [Saccharomyces uvarum]|uniref:RNA polymerase II subunit B1 CTD phosphatase RPAP2 homolog n=1 Tax=Saccharomyces uvarum TaxID=230603 RepID=A0AA35JDF4_SACUV|nr:hypothetical protein SUVC_02G1960 [Saccharomyces uvarum]
MMSVISIPLIQNEILQAHQLHEQLSLFEAQMVESAIVSMLSESFCNNEQTLKYLARLLSPTSYLDIINARSGNKICGYPLCHERTSENLSNGILTYSIYCSKFHSRCSLYLMRQLPQVPLYERSGVHSTSYYNPSLNDVYNVDLLEESIRNRISTDTVTSLTADFGCLEVDDIHKDDTTLLDEYFEQGTTEENTNMKY